MHQDFASNAKCNFADFRTNTHTNSFGYESNFETLWSNLEIDEVFHIYPQCKFIPLQKERVWYTYKKGSLGICSSKTFFSSVGPSGRPKFIRERLSTSSTSLSLVWAPPPQSSINAEFGGYELTYKPSNYIKANTSAIQINVRDSISIQVSIGKNRCSFSASIAF